MVENTTEVSDRADSSAPLARPKTIILFSDGTGNSSGKLFKTNVFRLYQALNLGINDGHASQIAYYDNGVGTSSIKVLAIIGGIFGFGLKRNVLHIYRFLCRNYNDGDRIYAFGFSRGAFTIRLLVALICTRGIVPFANDRELKQNSSDVFYRFIDGNGPDVFRYLWLTIRSVRNGLRRVRRLATGGGFNVAPKHEPMVDFIGVWDTVAAYGGPISEITRGIDKYVWPLTMTDYGLHPKVRQARHALALDDERDSFWPLIWDEVNEERLAKAAKDPAERNRFRDRLKQVWFAGMHSDVGGGYPDDSLSYVSLSWMINEIDGGLEFLPGEVVRIQAFANPLGPIHDSRQGLGAYYRYQPRKISALLHSPPPDVLKPSETLALRDPTVGEKRAPPEGMLTSCSVHESVIQRIGIGTDNYAPIGLPTQLNIISGNLKGILGLDPKVVASLQQPSLAKARAEQQENAWDDVWRRRAGYFVIVAVSIFLAASPLYARRWKLLPETDARWAVDIVIGWLKPFVPSLAIPWFEAFQLAWPVFLSGGLVIALVAGRMQAQSVRLRDRSRIAWWQAIKGSPDKPAAASRLRRFRNSRWYQLSLQQFKWRLVPAMVGIGVLLLIPYTVAVVTTQISLAIDERRDGTTSTPQLCSAGGVGKPLSGSISMMFRADDVCHPLGITVVRGHRYRIVFEGTGDVPSGGWIDGGYAVALEGQGWLDFPPLARPVMLLASPFKRVVPASWLEPLVEIRGPLTRSEVTGIVSSRIAIERLTPLSPPIDDRRNRFVGEFEARFDGSLHLFLNDAVLPLIGTNVLYRNNRGTTRVCVMEAEDVHDGCDVEGWIIKGGKSL